jgi:hypothetical protein
LSGQFDTAHVGCPKDYLVQNNAWGSTAGQSIQYGSGTKFKVVTQNGNNAGNGMPAGYPDIFIGSNNGHSTTQSGLPLAVSAITATGVSTSWSWSDSGVSGNYNATYDVWFSTGSGGDATDPSCGYLMVWFSQGAMNQPLGTMVQNGTFTLNGNSFTVWSGTQKGKPVISYVASSPRKIMSWTYPLGAFIRDAVSKNYIANFNSCYLTNVFSGFEIWSGGVGLQTTDFGVTVP